MTGIDNRERKLRAISLVAVGAVVVHQLRYLIAYGNGAAQALHDQGHDYLSLLALPIAALLAIACGHFLERVARADVPPGANTTRRHAVRTWLTVSIALLTIYMVQESLEGSLFAGHWSGVEGMFGHGGWVTILLALAVGKLITVVIGLADIVLRRVVRGWQTRTMQYDPAPRGPFSIDLPALNRMAVNLAGRAPPQTSS